MTNSHELIGREVGELISEGVKEILQEKHLYQSVDLELSLSVLGEIVKSGEFDPGPFPNGVTLKSMVAISFGHFTGFMAMDWRPDDLSRPALHNPRGTSDESHIRFRRPNIKIYCEECDRVEPHNPADGNQIIPLGDVSYTVKYNPPHQWYWFGYLCQSCQNIPTVFLIQRIGTRLTFSGRSPMESVQIPAFIPKETRKHYASAIVSHQAGYTLAGIFYLRTFIEQTARAVVGKIKDNGTGDELMDAYMMTVPLPVRDGFPSLRKIYGELSADIHSAAGDAKLFEKCVEQINEHFDAKRLYAKRMT